MKKSTEHDKELSVRLCDRCGRRSPDLMFDDLSLRDLCPECRQALESRRVGLRRATAKMP